MMRVMTERESTGGPVIMIRKYSNYLTPRTVFIKFAPSGGLSTLLVLSLGTEYNFVSQYWFLSNEVVVFGLNYCLGRMY